MYILNSTTNPGKPLAVKWSLGGSLQSREKPKDHLATFVCPGFVVKFDNQTITSVESHAPYHFLAGRSLSQYLLLRLLLYMVGDNPSLP